MKNLLKNLLKSNNSRGDLLIEVMLAMAVLAVILTGGYVLSHRSLSSSTNADLRSQAQSFAQGQIEHMVNTQNTNPAELSKYTLSDPFCILADGTVDIDMNSTTHACFNFESPIDVTDQYDKSSKTFTITARWPWPSDNNQVKLYYKLPVNFTGEDLVLNTYIRGVGSGKITSQPSGIDCSNLNLGSDKAKCTEAYATPQTVILTAAAKGNNSAFSKWDGDCDTINGSTCTVNVNGLKYVSAYFEPTGGGGKGGHHEGGCVGGDTVCNGGSSGGSGGNGGGSGDSSGGSSSGGSGCDVSSCGHSCADFETYPGASHGFWTGGVIFNPLLFIPIFGSPLCP